MCESFYLKSGDTAPVLEAVLLDENGESIDLNDAEVQFRLQEPRGGSPVLNDAATSFDANGGIVRYSWSEDEISELTGRFRADFIVDYPDGSQETFPNDGFHDVIITD
ncbi:BppU family phage baseplate upper protein [Natrialba asiatica]|uniref:BppU N-terminal domain-containing protein n=1 Tax=Natrialba asiatica (strain ATCC 700177 / DSM 12278 / JCM 9576 / FERM P-10747 / NBRC 102637 / 172P1) TaxID=29540 RepID=M0AR18_NATA1|nr:BppU family phage baseplate upper protein [Natrialba asiatica]ELZ00772.1 hypothetical protein C481_11075 [Natrialba asiatica DSM 12278]